MVELNAPVSLGGEACLSQQQSRCFIVRIEEACLSRPQFRCFITRIEEACLSRQQFHCFISYRGGMSLQTVTLLLW